MRAALELEGSGIRRLLQLIVLLCPALTVAVRGGANGSLMLGAALSLFVLARQRLAGGSAATGGDDGPRRAFVFAMAAPVVVLIAVQALHGGPWKVGAISSTARFLLAVPLVIVLWRVGRALAPWADASFALGGLAAGAVMLFAPREWHPGRWGSAFLDPINFGSLALLLGVLSLLSIDWYRRDPLPIRLLKVAGFCGGAVASVPTGARGPWLAVLMLIVVLAFTTLRGRSLAMRVALWVSLAAALLVAFATIDAFRGRFDLMAGGLDSFFWGSERDTSPGVRLQIWRAALMAFAERPLLGLGGEGFVGAVDHYLALGVLSPLAAEFARAEMHNSYLAYAVDFGIPGLLAIAALFAVPAWAFAQRLGAGRVRGRAALMGLVVVTMYAACAMSVDVLKLKMMAAFYAAATAFMAAIAFGGDVNESADAGAVPPAVDW
jgi:O-antigen ligase